RVDTTIGLDRCPRSSRLFSRRAVYGLGPGGRGDRPLRRVGPVAGPLREFAVGARYLGRGLGIVTRSPKLFMLGAIPAVITTALLISALIALGVYATDIAAWATPFADGWTEWSRQGVRILGAVLVLMGGLAVSVVA